MTHKPSHRFGQTWITARLVPALLFLLTLALIATLALIVLSMINIP